MNDKPKTWEDLSPLTHWRTPPAPQPQLTVQPGPQMDHAVAARDVAARHAANVAGQMQSPTMPTTEWWSTSEYACLRDVLRAAYDQAAIGKGAERHANNLPFEDQPMQHLIELHGVGFAAGQVSKKMAEASGMLSRGETSAAMREILGAIVYASGVAVYIHHNKE